MRCPECKVVGCVTHTLVISEQAEARSKSEHGGDERVCCYDRESTSLRLQESRTAATSHQEDARLAVLSNTFG